MEDYHDLMACCHIKTGNHANYKYYSQEKPASPQKPVFIYCRSLLIMNLSNRSHHGFLCPRNLADQM